jgi:hypothetical protein|eukprot:COSAG01_NODE_15079_length_1377_cov_0.788732_1_plen_46_part_00
MHGHGIQGKTAHQQRPASKHSALQVQIVTVVQEAIEVELPQKEAH